MTLLELTDKEKGIFLDWLQQREKAIQEEVSLLKNLRLKLEDNIEAAKAPEPENARQPNPKKEFNRREETITSWVDTLKKELSHFSHPVPSGEIVKRLLQKPLFANKGKRFITKAVTSKLWLLQERGEVSKTRENGRYVYALKK